MLDFRLVKCWIFDALLLDFVLTKHNHRGSGSLRAEHVAGSHRVPDSLRAEHVAGSHRDPGSLHAEHAAVSHRGPDTLRDRESQFVRLQIVADFRQFHCLHAEEELHEDVVVHLLFCVMDVFFLKEYPRRTVCSSRLVCRSWYVCFSL